MRVFIAGATGVLGRRLVERLAERGHEVFGLVRDEDGAEAVRDRGGTARYGDVLDVDTLATAMAGADTVVHAATALPVKTKPTDDDWARNDRVRVEGIQYLVAAADEGVERFFFPSVVWVARQPDGSPVEESSPRHPDRATRSAADVETYLHETVAAQGYDVTTLRFGFFYGADTGHTQQMGRQLLSGALPVVGGGPLGRRDAELSLIHVDDAARAFADAVDARVTGLYHVVDDQPVTVAEFFAAFAGLLDAPTPRRVPGWLAQFFVGRESVNLLTRSFPTDADRFKREVGWEPSYPTCHDGLVEVVETWERDGTLRRTESGFEWVAERSTREPPTASETLPTP